jgi:hypothetical protein
MKRISFGNVRGGVWVGVSSALLYLACSSPGSLPGSGGGAGGGGGGVGGVTIPTVVQGGASGEGGGGGSGVAGTTGTAEGTCGATTITPNRAPVDIFIVLDRSGSMGYSIEDDCYCAAGVTSGGTGGMCRNAGSGCTDRWTAVKNALSQTISANPTINWGLEFYTSPTGVDCSVSLSPQIPISATAGATILAQMDTVSPGNHTPTAAAINAATLYVQTVNDGNSKAILLATDGMPNCVGGRVNNDDDMPATTNAVAGAARLGVPVYVVGMGPQESITNLDALAVAGGTTQYYPANSAQALSDALATISKIVSTTCEFQTPQSPPDDSKVYVYVDKQLIGQSPDNGWTFGATSSDIVLTGNYCADMLAGQTSTVEIIFGCKDYIPPDIIP